MDSEEVRKVRCAERIKEVLKEESCVLESSITIVGNKIVQTQVLVFAKAVSVDEEIEEKGEEINV